MPSPSSIFSFDTLQLDRRVPWALLIALAILVAIDFGISRADWPYRALGPSYVKEFFTLSDRAAAAPPPCIAILGNSRSQCGLLAADLETALRLPPGSVQNYSLRTGDHYDNRLFHRRNREHLRRAPLLIVAVDAYQWNTHFALSERFTHFAGWRDRWALQRTLRSLLGGVFRTAQKGPLYRAMATDALGRVRQRFHRQAAPKSAAPTPTDAPLAAAIAPLSLDAAQGLDPAGNLIATWYAHFRLSPERESLLRDVLREAARDGQRVLVVQMPFRDAYMQELQRAHAAEYAAYRAAVHALPNVDVLFFEDASRYGLADADFLDWNHLNEAGAATFARTFAAALPEDLRPLTQDCRPGSTRSEAAGTTKNTKKRTP